MATGNTELYADFSGGLNLEAGPYLLSNNQCQDCRNVRASQSGALEKRLGSTNVSQYLNSATPPVQQLNSAHTLFATTGAFNGFIAVGPVFSGGADDSIVKITPAGITTTLKTGQESNKRWSWVQGPVSGSQGPYYGMNGEDTPQYWDGVSAGTADWTGATGTVPTGTDLLIYHLDKFWASGDPVYPGRLWSTGVAAPTVPPSSNEGLPDPRNWDTAFVDDVEPNDGEDITALGKVGPYLLVFKQRKTYVLSDPVNRSYRNVSSQIGCSAPRTVVETLNGTMFLSEDLGVCITDGTNITTVSDRIQVLLDDIARLQPEAMKHSVATFYRGSYYLSVPYNDTKNSITLEFQIENGAWWVHSLPYDDFALFDNGGTLRLYGPKTQSAQMNKLFNEGVFSDQGQAYESYWEGPYWTWGEPHINKRITQLRVDGLGSWQIDAGTTFGDVRENIEGVPWEEATTDTSLFAGSGIFQPSVPPETSIFAPGAPISQYRYYTPTDGWGRAWSLKIKHLEASVQNMQVHSISAFVRTRTD